MPGRYIKRKGIIFNEIVEKGDIDQVTNLQKENRQLMEKLNGLDGEYRKVRDALEFITSIVGCMDTEDLKRKVFEKRKNELAVLPDRQPADYKLTPSSFLTSSKLVFC
jgi:predicted nuclease with TOPRIM domain